MAKKQVRWVAAQPVRGPRVFHMVLGEGNKARAACGCYPTAQWMSWEATARSKLCDGCMLKVG